MATENITEDSLKALCLAAVEKDGINLQFVPERLRTHELCLTAFQQRGYADWSALEFVPEELKTPELCRMAIQQSACALEFVPEKLKTLELCYTAIQESCYPYNEYAFVPPEFFKSTEFCHSIVQMDSWEPKAGVYVWTTALCIEAVRKDAWAALPYIPDALKTLEVGIAAVQAQPFAIVLLPRFCRHSI